MPRATKPPHRSSAVPPRRRRVISPRPRLVEEEEPIIERVPPVEVSSLHPAAQHEEKRRLILAHAQARRERPRSFGFFHYVAIVASCFVVMVGWWMTMERNFALPQVASNASFSSLFQNSLQTATEQQQNLFPATESPSTPLDRRLNEAQQEVAEAQVMDQTARRLLQPLSTSSASTTSLPR